MRSSPGRRMEGSGMPAPGREHLPCPRCLIWPTQSLPTEQECDESGGLGEGIQPVSNLRAIYPCSFQVESIPAIASPFLPNPQPLSTSLSALRYFPQEPYRGRVCGPLGFREVWCGLKTRRNLAQQSGQM